MRYDLVRTLAAYGKLWSDLNLNGSGVDVTAGQTEMGLMVECYI